MNAFRDLICQRVMLLESPRVSREKIAEHADALAKDVSKIREYIMKKINCLFIFLLIFFKVAIAMAATLPTLPQTYIDTTYSSPTGATCTAANSSAFQTCLNNAALNSTIVLNAGTTYTGLFTLPNKTSGSGWIYIISSNLASLPGAGTRVGPSDSANMPKIVTSNQDMSITVSSGAHHYRFVGIEFTTAGQFSYGLVDLGNNSNNITIDRCYLHGSATNGSRRGVSINGTYQAVIDSYLTDFVEDGGQTQAVAGWSGAGPFKIVNNYLAAGGMSFMFGGSGAPQDLVPSDIEIRRNYLHKPTAWYSTQWDLYNMFELKNSRRVLIQGNRIENYLNGIHGWAAILRCSAVNNGNPWVRCEDITVKENYFKNIYAGVDIMGRDDEGGVNPAQRILIKDNLFENITPSRGMMVLGGGTGWSNNITFDHNTILVQDYSYGCLWVDNGSTADFTWTNNICTKGGIAASGLGVADIFTNLLPGSTFTKNVMQGASSSGYPVGNYFPATVSGIGFVNYQTNDGNYRLSASSPYKNAGTDGKDLGADIDAIEAAIAGSVTTILAPTNLRILP